jgi:hypothetical protein
MEYEKPPHMFFPQFIGTLLASTMLLFLFISICARGLGQNKIQIKQIFFLKKKIQQRKGHKRPNAQKNKKLIPFQNREERIKSKRLNWECS